MAVEIKVPDMGESVIEATIARWMKQEGEPVAVGEPLVELETDKINLEVGSQQAGVLQRIEKQAGETVAVGDVLAVVAAENEAAAPAQAKPPEAAAPSQAEQRQPEAAPYQGGKAEEEKRQPDVVPQTGQEPQTAQRQPEQNNQAVSATPVAARMAQEMGVDLARILPSGPGGKITKEDVQAFVKQGGQAEQGAFRTPPAQAAPTQAAVQPAQTAPARPAPAPQPQPTPGDGREAAQIAGRETRQRMSRRRQTIARRLVEAQQTAAMLTTFNEIDMSAVMELRKRRREGFKERYGVDLGFMSFFVKAAIGALKAFPMVNAEIASSPQGDEIVLKHYYDIGVAIGAEEGLVVPVIRDADRLNFAGIEKAIRDFVSKVKENKLTLEDLRGGTFTITNGGVFGSLMSTPILNPPQVGILGMHKIQERPVVVNGEIVARPMMYVALSYDHRIVDGREAVQFLVRVRELVEDPESLLFG